MSINFPSSPSLNQVYSYGGTNWIWNGNGWAIQTQAGGYTGSIGYTGSSTTLAVANDIIAGTDNTKAVTALSLFNSQAYSNVSYTSTITLDLTTSFNFNVGPLTGNIILANPSAGITTGRTGLIKFKQDATGSRTISSFGNNFVFDGNLSFQLGPTANTTTIVSYVVLDATHILLGAVAYNTTC